MIHVCSYDTSLYLLVNEANRTFAPFLFRKQTWDSGRPRKNKALKREGEKERRKKNIEKLDFAPELLPEVGHARPPSLPSNMQMRVGLVGRLHTWLAHMTECHRIQTPSLLSGSWPCLANRGRPNN